MHLSVKPDKLGLGAKGGWRSIFNGNLEYGELKELHSYINLVNFSLVDYKAHFPKNKILTFTTWGVSDMFKPNFDNVKLPHRKSIQQQAFKN